MFGANKMAETRETHTLRITPAQWQQAEHIARLMDELVKPTTILRHALTGGLNVLADNQEVKRRQMRATHVRTSD